MKKLILFGTLFIAVHFTQAQLLKKLKEKVDNKVNGAVDKKVGDATKGNKDDNSGSNTDAGNDSKNSAEPASLKTYSKYDFVPGERIIVYEDFMQDAVGDFPAKWNTNSSGEIVTIEGKPGHWLRLNKQGIFMPDFIDSLPNDYTFEYDLLCDNPGKIWSLYTSIVNLADHNRPEGWRTTDSRFTFTVATGVDGSTSILEREKNGASESSTTGTKKFTNGTTPVHIAVWRQKERVRVYFDEEK